MEGKKSTKSLLIVESPTKAKTISRFLGSNFIVDSSYGHIRDLPQSKLGVDVEHGFDPQYVIPRNKMPIVKKLREAAKRADLVIAATDEDREGEAIAWHLIQTLGLGESKTSSSELGSQQAAESPARSEAHQVRRKPKAAVERIVFHEITERAIEEALKNPRDIDMNRVDAQQARRVLDRLVGYKLSPFLWKKVFRGLSAGRVQSVAVRFIVEREREIQNFVTQEYWSIEALLQKENRAEFPATLIKINGEALDKFAIKNAEKAERILKNLGGSRWMVEKIDKKALVKNPLPPFTTSTLQQEAFRKLGFSAKQTMFIAQQLYEGVELDEGPAGLITYMRTDSLNLSDESLLMARDVIHQEFGKEYLSAVPRRFKTKTKGAQEAHEAIRPTDPKRNPEVAIKFLDRKQHRLYDLIWRRFTATQMAAAVLDATIADIVATKEGGEESYIFRATGQIIKFPGFLRVYPIKFSEVTLPVLSPTEKLELKELKPIQHSTQPPPRFTEATLVKTLEQNGIGRPSTYAPIISTIQERRYIEKFEKRYLKPTETGILVNDLLVEHFPEVVDIQFTAEMEEELDKIAEGKIAWKPVIKRFYEPFAAHLEEKYREVKKYEAEETTEETCERCGKAMVVRLGRFGKFLACSGFPECKNTKSLNNNNMPESVGMKCPKCTEGDVIVRRTRRKKIFFGCSRYPACDYASWTDPRK